VKFVILHERKTAVTILATCKILSEKLRATENFTPVAAIRNEDQKEYFSSRDIETKLTDLEGSMDELKKAMQGSDAIVFTAGSGAKTGP
jgi:acetate kinase